MRTASLPMAILGATVFLVGLSSSAIGPYRGIAAIDGLGMSNAAFAVVTSISSIGTAAASLLLGHFADRIADRRLGVVACAAISAAAYALVFVAPSQATYAIAFCLILPFGGAIFSQVFSFSRAYCDATQPHRAAFMMSALRTLFSLAWVAAPATVGWLAARYSVYSVFGAAACAQIALLLVFSGLFLIPRTRIGPATALQAKLSVRSSLSARRIIGFLGVLFSRIALFLHLMGMPLLLTNNFHASLSDVSVNAAVCAGLEIPFMLLWGHAATRFSKENIIALNGALYALYLVLVYASHSVLDVLLLQGINAVATAALVSLPISYMQETIKGRVGLSTALFDIATVAGQMSASAIFAATSTRSNFLPVIIAAALVSAMSAAAMALSARMGSRGEAGEIASEPIEGKETGGR